MGHPPPGKAVNATAVFHAPPEAAAAAVARPVFVCQTAFGSAEIHDRIDAIDPAIWQTLFPSHWKNYEYYRTLADTFSAEFPQRYLLLKNGAGEICAIQPFFFVRQDLTVSLPGTLRRLLLAVRRWLFPRFLTLRLMMVGCVVGEGQTGLASGLSPADRADVFTALDVALACYARRERIGIRLWKDFPAATRGDLTPALRAGLGHVRIPSLPAVSLSLEGLRSFDEFLDSRLGKSTRKSLRRKFREAEAAATAASAPLVLEVKNHVTDAEAAEVHALYERIAHRGDIHFEVFTKDYFLLLSQRMPEQAHFFIWRRAGRVVAFAFCMVQGDAIYDNDIGLDYDVAHELHLYHVTFRDLVNWATAHGLRRYHSSPFNYHPKLRLRMELAPLDLYVRHRFGFIQFFLRRFAPLLEPTRQEPVLREFPNFGQIHGATLPPPPDPGALAPKSPRLLVSPRSRRGFGALAELLLTAIFGAAAEIFLKLGAVETANDVSWLPAWLGIGGLASGWVWLGMLFTVLGFITYLRAMRVVPLGVAFTLSNFVHVLIPLSAWLFLGESISPRRWLGIGLVLVGLFVLARPYTRVEERL